MNLASIYKTQSQSAGSAPSQYQIRRSRAGILGNLFRSILFNILAFVIILSVFAAIAIAAKYMTGPISRLENYEISLAPSNLLTYSLQTVTRMLIALCCSLIFALIYASLAAKSKRCEQILIPFLDILQSVPILGYISFTVTGFLLLFPSSMLGPQLAVIFALVTSQAWNMVFSLYQSLKDVPSELIEAAKILKMSPWQRFWRAELPFGLPALVWNISLSMSGGWFVIVAAEVISVGDAKIALPGIGSYIAVALAQKDLQAIIYAIIAIITSITLYDQIFVKTLIVWADKFRYESVAGGSKPPSSWVYDIMIRSSFVSVIGQFLALIARFILYLPILNQKQISKSQAMNISVIDSGPLLSFKTQNIIWYTVIIAILFILFFYFENFLQHNITLKELGEIFFLACITMVRIIALMIMATVIWVPIGIYIGMHPKLSQIVPPAAQLLAAIPAHLLFPVAAIVISTYEFNPNIALTFLMMFSPQWYILFNVIAGSASFPTELKEVATNLKIKNFLWYRKVMIPAIMPFFITGAITASGAAWNASIISEIVTYGDKTIVAQGLGSYITLATQNASFAKIIASIGIMSLFVVLCNQFFWQPLHEYVNRRFKL